MALFGKFTLFGGIPSIAAGPKVEDDGDDEVFKVSDTADAKGPGAEDDAKFGAEDKAVSGSGGSGSAESGDKTSGSGKADDGPGHGGSGGSGSGSHGSGSGGTGSGSGSGGSGVPCFVEGTLVETARGAIPVEDVRPGDRVVTLDHGLQPVLWAGSTTVAAIGQLAPVVIAPHTFGPGLPARPLAVSRQHRMLCRGWPVELWFGADEVLAPAGGLVNGAGITLVASGRRTTYHHLLFDSHELLRANGCWSESLLPRDMALAALSPEARVEIAAALGHDGTTMRAARPCIGLAAACVLGAALAEPAQVGTPGRAAA
jgi:hypothetical protein